MDPTEARARLQRKSEQRRNLLLLSGFADGNATHIVNQAIRCYLGQSS